MKTLDPLEINRCREGTDEIINYNKKAFKNFFIVISEIPKNIELSAMKDLPNFCKKRGPHSDICFSLILTPGKKMKDFIVYGNVLDKNLLQFHQIHLHLTETPPAKSGLQQENEKLKNGP
jgi:hypothetical protein